jgi:catechol 2,3-dioxygenase-like lactoylglutathione lyase family enzyme
MILKHIALICTSEEKADTFYVDLLGLTKMEPKIISATLSQAIFNIHSDLKIVNYVGENLHFEVFIHNQTNPETARIEHTCIEVDDRPSFLEKCKTFGIKTMEIPVGDHVLIFISDHNNNRFEIKGK